MKNTLGGVRAFYETPQNVAVFPCVKHPGWCGGIFKCHKTPRRCIGVILHTINSPWQSSGVMGKKRRTGDFRWILILKHKNNVKANYRLSRNAISAISARAFCRRFLVWNTCKPLRSFDGIFIKRHKTSRYYTGVVFNTNKTPRHLVAIIFVGYAVNIDYGKWLNDYLQCTVSI